MGQLIDVVFGLTRSQDQFPFTGAHNRLEFRGLLPRTHHLCVTAQAYTHTLTHYLPPSCRRFSFPSMKLNSGHNITEEDTLTKVRKEDTETGALGNCLHVSSRLR